MSEQLLNQDWIFWKDNGEAQSIALPHTYNAADGQSGTSMWRGIGYYKKEIELSEEMLAQPLFLEIGAAAMISKVIINGSCICENTCPYSLYRVRLNGHVKAGLNEIKIQTDNRATDAVYPQMADFSFYGGVYRDVKLVSCSGFHFDLLDGSRDGIQVTTEKKENGSWSVQAKGRIISENGSSNGQIRIFLMDGTAAAAKASADVTVNGSEEFCLEMTIEHPHLWQGIQDPYLYQLKAELVQNEAVTDSRAIGVGFRTVEITPDHGLFLNGRHLKIRGVARHQDFGGVGCAVSKEQMEQDMQLVKELGANSVRLSHYQHDDYFYRRCDEEGILVWAEVPYISILSENPEAEANIRQQMRCLILQCGNHPSIYCWGVQNEITIAGENEEIRRHVKAMAEYTKSLDPHRYTAEANIYSVPNESPLNKMTDLVGYNLYYGWYYDEIPDLQKRLDEFHQACPDIPLMVTEYGVDTNPQYHSYEPKTKDYSEEYQLMFSENALRAFEEREYFVGSYVWNMCDFGSANRDEGGKQGQNQKGLVTIDRTLKKDAFYLYKAHWSEEAFVKLAGSRFVNRHRKENAVAVMSNLKKLELYRNGELIGKTEHAEPLTTFSNCILEPGENQILVKGWDEQENEFQDQMLLRLVEEEDRQYQYVKKDDGGHVINWFEKFDLTDTEEIELDPDCFSSADKVGEIMKHPAGEQVILKYFGELVDHPKFAMIRMMTLDAMGKLRNLGIPAELISAINRELNQIKK